MKAFCLNVGLAKPPVSEDGSIRLAFDGMVVSFRPSEDGTSLVTWAVVGALPPEGRETLLTEMMKAMFMGQATSGATLSLEEGTDRILLHRSDPLLPLEPASFMAQTDKFVNTLEHWQKLVADYPPAARQIEKSEYEFKSAERQAFCSPNGFLRV